MKHFTLRSQGQWDTKGYLTKTYQYTVTGELTFDSAAYENEYTYNGESYNSNIHSQYLRARYYSVVTASFLTEDSYLGNILCIYRATGNGVLYIIQKTRTRRPYPEVFTSFSAQIRTEGPGIGKEKNV